MQKLILIEKHLPGGRFWPNLEKDKRIMELSVQEILNKYQGFDGELISCFSIEGNNNKLNKYFAECLDLNKLSDCNLLHIITGSESIPSYLREQSIQMGYEVGAFDEEGNIYSSIFNEILFGKVEELVVFKKVLNENLLFPDKSAAEKYVEMHNQMSIRGKDVENGVEMTIYEIWKYSL